MKNKVVFVVLLLPFLCFAQTFSGRVIDKVTQQPIETVAVYFDNTTIGTTTNENGEFSITYSAAVQSTLVISYLGYEKVFIQDYRSKNNITIELVEAENALDEVYLEFDDGLTRRQKLRLFRKEFLGTSKFARSCRILNDDDLVLRYNKKQKALYANSSKPILVENRALQYKISFEINEFEIKYRYANLKTNNFTLHSVTYTGTNFFENLEKFHKKRFIKNRELAYRGSVQHFMRALFNKDLAGNNYQIFNKRFKVNEWDFFEVHQLDNKDLRRVTLKDKVAILFEKSQQSAIQLEVAEFYVDKFGNYAPIKGVYFSGTLGNQRVGDALPSDYGFEN